MKQSMPILFIAAMLSPCGSNRQTKVAEKSKEIQLAIKPGTAAVSAGGYTMKAKIDANEWVAAYIVPPEAAGRNIGYYNGEYIGLQY